MFQHYGCQNWSQVRFPFFITLMLQHSMSEFEFKLRRPLFNTLMLQHNGCQNLKSSEMSLFQNINVATVWGSEFKVKLDVP